MQGNTKPVGEVTLLTTMGLLGYVAMCLMSRLADQEASASMPAELEEFVARAIIDEQLDHAAYGSRSPEGAIVAHVATPDADDEPIRVWRYSEGQLAQEDAEAFQKALGNNRSDWPSFTFIFAFKSVTSRKATVDVYTCYDMGITESSRGGNAQKWELRKRSGEWVVTKREPYMFWD